MPYYQVRSGAGSGGCSLWRAAGKPTAGRRGGGCREQAGGWRRRIGRRTAVHRSQAEETGEKVGNRLLSGAGRGKKIHVPVFECQYLFVLTI